MAHQRRSHSPVGRVFNTMYDSASAMRVDALGNIDNPYAYFGELIEEKVRGPSAHAYDGREHRVEVVEWARIIDSLLDAKMGKGNTLHVGRQYALENGSVNFVVEDMSESDKSAVGALVAFDLPKGCTLFMGDASEGASPADASIARRPRENKFFITVTERAQSNLEHRRAVGARVRSIDWCFFILALVMVLGSVYALMKHHENHSNAWNTLADSASEQLSLIT
jgi:hypothetical protein